MKLFSGFPDGKVTVTPLPNLFFSELLPAIDDLDELKVTLHIYWKIANSRLPYVSLNDLKADRTLIQSLNKIQGKPEDSLDHGLGLAVERHSLLCLTISVDANGMHNNLYFLNTENGRLAIQRMEHEGIRQGISQDSISIIERPNIFVLYEQNIGILNPMIAEELKQAEKEFTAEELQYAFKEAVRHNALNWSYISKVLENRKTLRQRGDKTRRKRWLDDE
jgi:DnaD/phage-associated family protein